MMHSRRITIAFLASTLMISAARLDAQSPAPQTSDARIASPEQPESPRYAQNSEHTLTLKEGVASPAADIEQLSWLAGYWRGKGLGGDCEEAWGPPIGDRMTGWFTLRQDGELVFSEAMTLVEENGSLVLKVKHFHPDFVGWEEKEDFVAFPLVHLGDQEAFFDGLTIGRVGDELTIYVVISQGDERKEHPFRFSRKSW